LTRLAGLSDAKILAVDTCLGACSVAVIEGERVLAGRFAAMERGHAEALAPMVEAAMQECGFAFSGLDLLAVTTGPGTFTGQRVGLAFMRALRVALGKPLIGVTSLAAMAEQARRQTGLAIGAAVHDAKRDEVYIEMRGAPLAAQLMTFSAATELLRPFADIALAGTAAPRLIESCTGAKLVDVLAPDAVWVARLAGSGESCLQAKPLYLRPPDAKLPGAH
jgi:tRNA threonylcarbamoyladenosine biosynthesis protein TsaB